jgi:hypothetical protein
MGHDHNITVRMLLVQTTGDAGDTIAHVTKTLIDELELIRVLQIGLQLAGEDIRQ